MFSTGTGALSTVVGAPGAPRMASAGPDRGFGMLVSWADSCTDDARLGSP